MKNGLFPEPPFIHLDSAPHAAGFIPHAGHPPHPQGHACPPHETPGPNTLAALRAAAAPRAPQRHLR